VLFAGDALVTPGPLLGSAGAPHAAADAAAAA